MFTIKKEGGILIYFIDPVSGITSRKKVYLIRYLKIIFGKINDSENFFQSILRWKKKQNKSREGN